MSFYITQDTTITNELLNVIAYLPTKSLDKIIAPEFFCQLEDKHFMRIAVLLAQKSYEEGGCPIGAVIIDKDSQKILGKGHNTLVQENHPYNHGETSAIRDAGRIDFSKTLLFTSLSPCDVCTALICMRHFHTVFIGNTTSASGNEATLQKKGVEVKILEDHKGIKLYDRFRLEKPHQDLEDWRGLAAVNKSAD